MPNSICRQAAFAASSLAGAAFAQLPCDTPLLPSPTLVTFSHDAAVADFDGDGALDLVTIGGVNIAIHRGLGDGAFEPMLFFPSPAGVTEDVAFAQAITSAPGLEAVVLMNQDLVAVGRAASGEIEVLAHVQTLATNNFGRIELFDLDSDGDDDLVATLLDAPGSPEDALIALNDGEFGFATPVLFSFASEANFDAKRATCADADNDGDLDLFVAGEDHVVLLLNDGAGQFEITAQVPTGLTLLSFLPTDADGDGALDLVVGGNGANTPPEVVVLRSTLLETGALGYEPLASYQFGGAARGLFSADVDGDGDPDILACIDPSGDTASALHVIRNDGGGSLTSQPAIPVAAGANCIVADVNNDDRPDLVGPFSTDSIIPVHLTNDLALFGIVNSEQIGQPTDLAVADLDGDGASDAVVSLDASAPAGVTLLTNEGGGTFAPPVEYAIGGDPARIATTDIDGDGDIDVIRATVDGQISVLTNESGALIEASSLTIAEGVRGLVAAELDADGDVDVAVLNQANNEVAILTNDGAGVLTLASVFPTGLDPNAIDAGDVDGDGDIDLAISHGEGGHVSMLLNSGPAQFTVEQVVDVLGPSADVALVDLQGDGALDLLALYADAKQLHVLRGTGAGSFDEPVVLTTSTAPHTIATGDIDGDADTDVALATASAGKLPVYLNKGDGAFATFDNGDGKIVDFRLFNARADTVDVAIEDVTGDGRGDIIAAVADPASNSFGARVLVLPTECPAAPCPADLNDDGALNVLDFAAFHGAFHAREQSADCNADGEHNILDFLCFFEQFVAGCGEQGASPGPSGVFRAAPRGRIMAPAQRPAKRRARPGR